MRIGEASGLQWGDLDFEDRFAEVRRAINDGQVSTPKSGKGRRVDLSAKLAQALRAHQIAQRHEKRRGAGRACLPGCSGTRLATRSTPTTSATASGRSSSQKLDSGRSALGERPA